MMLDDDEILARQLQEEYDREAAVHLEQHSGLSKQLNVKSLRGSGTRGGLPELSQRSASISPVDPSLEFTDPNPDIRLLFLQFNEDYFYGKLLGIEVKWSPRMTLCAGVCVYEGHGGLCSVRLSQPLLKLRPRKDLVETLLHEMIHAYLFITDHDRDRDGHGPNFQKHMHRINKATGANITIYHTFHDEVSSYQQHWWRCNGPCQNRKPFFGYVKRAMNRAPSANDFWWAEHRATCGGTYTKIKEPEEYGKKKAKKEQEKKNGGTIGKFLNNKQEVSGPTTSKGIHTLFGSIGTSKKVPVHNKGNTAQKGSIFSKAKSNGKVSGKSNTSFNASSVIVGGMLIPKACPKQSSLFTSVGKSDSHILQSNPGTSESVISHTSKKTNIPHPSSEDKGIKKQKEIKDVLHNMYLSETTVSKDDRDFRGGEKKFKHKGKNDANSSSSHKKEIQKLPQNFLSVCEGGRGGLCSRNFFSPNDMKKRKKKTKKRYILDELDNDEGLWDINDHSGLEQDVNQPSTSANNVSSVSPLQKQLKDVCKFPNKESLSQSSFVKKDIFKNNSPNQSDACESSSTDHQKNPNRHYFPGSGYRLGHGQTKDFSSLENTQNLSQITSSCKTKSPTDNENSASSYTQLMIKTKRSFNKAFSYDVINVSDEEEYGSVPHWPSSKKVKEEFVDNHESAEICDRDVMATVERISAHSSNTSEDSGMGTGANVSASSTKTSEGSENNVLCPVCSVSVDQDAINNHLDMCLGIA